MTAPTETRPKLAGRYDARVILEITLDG